MMLLTAVGLLRKMKMLICWYWMRYLSLMLKERTDGVIETHLYIEETTDDSFRTYILVAENSLGRKTKYITLRQSKIRSLSCFSRSNRAHFIVAKLKDIFFFAFFSSFLFLLLLHLLFLLLHLLFHRFFFSFWRASRIPVWLKVQLRYKSTMVYWNDLRWSAASGGIVLYCIVLYCIQVFI